MKIALVCSAGMSTSMLVQKMREAAAAQGLEAHIDAYAQADLKNHMEDVDVILVGPQVRYLKGQIAKKAEPYNTPVEVIDQMAYGTMNGEKVLAQAVALTK
ncbi:PTS sugar transporter subunit IIB [Pontibacillus litoralis]|uniref:PTS cellobiose transporter subunit IIB n=1 Tax=Pontibacillus litoralis JSM 072002 TaxID=1385512 RepID=A0A0A5G479_9BACI|nr:PTS sugar transporter subunit IIB [Pontibacillus litoralis]KGX86859.1 PTS cellobiose transporter subunit IIB [Pontibacillus litoralis JSM 072002]